MLADSGDMAAAAELMAQALEAAPEWAAGWLMLGDFQRKAGEEALAIAAWQKAADLDPTGMLGAQMLLSSYGVAPVRKEHQDAYVTALFDHYARGFEQSLIEKLGYVVPEKLCALIGATRAERGLAGFKQMLDLGCGTGLMGDRMRHEVSHLVGVDLSAAMVAEARRKGVYDRAEQGELLAFLDGWAGEPADIVTAADVFMYCAALEPIFAAVYGRLTPGGLFAFSLERHDGPETQVLQASLRHAHSGEAVRQMLRGAGFDILRFEPETIRHDRGEPVPGLLVVASRPLGQPAAAPEALDAEAGEASAPAIN